MDFLLFKNLKVQALVATTPFVFAAASQARPEARMKEIHLSTGDACS